MLRRVGFTQQSNSRAPGGTAAPGAGRPVPAHRRAGAGAPGGRGAGDQRGLQEEGAGRELRARRPRVGARGRARPVRSHDFPDRDGRTPSRTASTTRRRTPGSSTSAPTGTPPPWRWSRSAAGGGLAGKDAYPGARRLLVTCDSGGSNGYRNRAWKAGLAALAQETGLDIEVCHFPPGTSKWNKIEHRLFCQISLAWRGRPLTSYDVIIDTIGAVTTEDRADRLAVLDENAYPTGPGIGDEQMRDIEERCLTRREWHGEWNYTLLAHPARPGPAAQAPPPAPARQEALNHPALTGLPPGGAAALAAALAPASPTPATPAPRPACTASAARTAPSPAKPAAATPAASSPTPASSSPRSSASGSASPPAASPSSTAATAPPSPTASRPSARPSPPPRPPSRPPASP